MKIVVITILLAILYIWVCKKNYDNLDKGLPFNLRQQMLSTSGLLLWMVLVVLICWLLQPISLTTLIIVSIFSYAPFVISLNLGLTRKKC